MGNCGHRWPWPILAGLLALLPARSLPIHAYGQDGPEGGAHRLLNTLALARFVATTAAENPILKRYDFFPSAEKYGLQSGAGGDLFLLQGVTAVESGWFRDQEAVRAGTFAWWIGEGGFAADAPEIRMGMRHFHDPTKGSGAGHLTDVFGPLLSPVMDAPTWALASSPHSWQHGQASLRLAWAAGDPDRRRGLLADAWRCLGETMHILADLTVPAHTRNDAHPFGDPYEDHVDADWISTYAADPRADWRIPDSLQQALADCRDPKELFRLVASYTNAFFFSNDTIASRDPATGRKVRSRNDEADYASPLLEDCRYDTGSGAYTTMDFKGLLLVAERSKRGSPVLTEACVHGQAQRLVPLAVAANVRLLDLLLPRLAVLVESLNLEKETLRGRLVFFDRDEAGIYWPGPPRPCQGLLGRVIILVTCRESAPRTNGFVLPVTTADGEGRFTVSLAGLPAEARAALDGGGEPAVGIDFGGILVGSGR